MPNSAFGSTGGGGTSGASGTVGNTNYAQVSPTSDPSFAALLAQILQQTPQREGMTSLQDMITGGMESPLLQSILGPAMQRLQAPQAQQRQNLTEATRAAGGLRGSTYGQDFNKLQQNQGQQQNDLMGQVIQQVLSSLISGQMQEQQNSFLPARSLTELLRTIAPSTVTSGGVSGSRGAWDAMSPSQGLQTPMMGDSMGPAGGAPPGGSGWGGNTGGRGGGGGTFQPAPSSGGGVAGGSQPQPPQYIDPLGGMGGGGGGWYDIGGGTGWLDSPATAQPTNPYEHTYTEIPQVIEGWW